MRKPRARTLQDTNYITVEAGETGKDVRVDEMMQDTSYITVEAGETWKDVRVDEAWSGH